MIHEDLANVYVSGKLAVKHGLCRDGAVHLVARGKVKRGKKVFDGEFKLRRRCEVAVVLGKPLATKLATNETKTCCHTVVRNDICQHLRRTEVP